MAEPRGLALLEAVERYVGDDAVRRQEFEIAVGDELLESCFCSIDDVSRLDFSHFDSVIGRLMNLLGKRDERAGAIAGMEPGEYWSLLLSSCAPTFDDDGNEVQIGERRPELWVGLVRRSIEAGMDASSHVYRQAIIARAGAAAAAIYDAVWAERTMNAHIGSPSVNAARHPVRRARCV